MSSCKKLYTIFFQINTLGLYKIFTILGGAFIGEGC